MIPVTYGYAGVSKTDDATRNLETQFHILREFGIREEHIFAAEADVVTSGLLRGSFGGIVVVCVPSEVSACPGCVRTALSVTVSTADSPSASSTHQGESGLTADSRRCVNLFSPEKMDLLYAG